MKRKNNAGRKGKGAERMMQDGQEGGGGSVTQDGKEMEEEE
jgi:hypothetical protein